MKIKKVDLMNLLKKNTIKENINYADFNNRSQEKILYLLNLVLQNVEYASLDEYFISDNYEAYITKGKINLKMVTQVMEQIYDVAEESYLSAS